MKTVITNSFTGYHYEIQTKGLPALSTVRKHLRKSKARECKSITRILMDGDEVEIFDHGNGPKYLVVLE